METKVHPCMTDGGSCKKTEKVATEGVHTASTSSFCVCVCVCACVCVCVCLCLCKACHRGRERSSLACESRRTGIVALGPLDVSLFHHCRGLLPRPIIAGGCQVGSVVQPFPAHASLFYGDGSPPCVLAHLIQVRASPH